MSETKRDYQVSRAKPPVHSRFKKGQSGNRRGPRPISLPTLLVDALNEKVVATIDGERREITKRKAVGTQLDGEPHHKAAAILGGETSRQRPGVMLPHISLPLKPPEAGHILDLTGSSLALERKCRHHGVEVNLDALSSRKLLSPSNIRHPFQCRRRQRIAVTRGELADPRARSC